MKNFKIEKLQEKTMMFCEVTIGDFILMKSPQNTEYLAVKINDNAVFNLVEDCIENQIGCDAPIRMVRVTIGVKPCKWLDPVRGLLVIENHFYYEKYKAFTDIEIGNFFISRVIPENDEEMDEELSIKIDESSYFNIIEKRVIKVNPDYDDKGAYDMRMCSVLLTFGEIKNN